jgi:hypothetical protein
MSLPNDDYKYNNALVSKEAFKNGSILAFYDSMQNDKFGNPTAFRRNPHVCPGKSTMAFRTFHKHEHFGSEKYVNPDVNKGVSFDKDIAKIQMKWDIAREKKNKDIAILENGDFDIMFGEN